ncbi:MAG: TetR/AcrR family transcriptional regulator [Actinomycetota bacterium]|nr:TetR/AcrR family transcriptional regulator [Actinomycetota bacterium]
MTRPGRPRSAASHRAILDATIHLLSEVGYPALSIEAVAARAGVGKGTVYRWWSSKAELVVEAVHDAALGMVAEPDTGSLRGDTRELVAGLVALACSPLGRVLEALSAEADRNPQLRETFDSVVLARRQEVATHLLDRARRRGEARSDLDVALVCDLAVATVFHRARMDPGALDGGFVDHLTDLLVAGVSGDPAQHPDRLARSVG